ncbi:adenine deaminase C-terminal domain-containing protein [Halococcus sp. PRR34]|uniref:adenine deaminase n=1 Tax=Halococcus sp. PRR34 TaxID=3020830 RepID=UPI002362905E|nr:adenine deaminase C-terminal domain-containing protein [Halococcus sp. PRR34]
MTSPVDTLVRGTVVDVLTGTLEDRAIAIDNGEVVAFGERPAARELEANYIAPGLINAHMHIESTMLTLPRYAEAVVPRGVTSIIADPHEIGNVLGANGVRALCRENDRTSIKTRFAVPSCVPATDLQTAGARIGPEDVAALCNEPNVVALGEVMDTKALLTGEAGIHAKIRIARDAGLRIDGHLSGISGADLQEAARFLDNDHESRTAEAAREKARAGLRLHLREGSSSPNLRALLPLIDEIDSRRLSLCTDNFYVDDLQDHAGIDEAVRMVIDAGVDPVTAVQLATVNTADAYGLPFGRIAPGVPADLVLLDDLETWAVAHVLINGKLDPEPVSAPETDRPELFERNTVQFEPVVAHDLAHTATTSARHTVRAIDHTSQTTAETIGTVPAVDGVLHANMESDFLPAAVIERHGNDGTIGTGFVHGFGLQRGAIASTVAHDAHNLVVVGTSHTAMARLANHLRTIGGGLGVYDPHIEDAENHTAGITSLELPIAGLLSSESPAEVARKLATVDDAARDLGLTLSGGVMELDNLTLEVIPELRLTDHGLVDVRTGSTVDVVLDTD